MAKRDMKIQNYGGGLPKYENEPEEGEIIDDYDLIVSSDEELSMRQRILELEAENEEIEQIAVISGSYADKLKNNRAAQVPTDVSSISSTEFITPLKRKRRKSKEHKKKHCHRQHPREYNDQCDHTLRYEQQKLSRKSHFKKAHCKRRQKLFAKKHKKIQSDRSIHKDLNAETSIESLEASDSSSITDADDNNGCTWFTSKRHEDAFNKGKYITRKTLRMAVARNTNESKSKKYCLKDKLIRQDLVGQPSKSDEYKYTEGDEIRDDNEEDDDVQVIENEPIIQTIDEDSTDSMEEKELRLIALKSAVLKKHLARKMRNAKVAYSPTDFDDMLSSSILHADNKMEGIDIIDLEDEDFHPACVTISPEASPQLQMLDDQDDSQQMVDCKPVDMDIANSDSEDATIDSWSKDVYPSPDSFDFANNVQYGFYMQKLNELPPPPPGVDDYHIVIPPPPYHMHFDPNVQDMDLDNGDFTEEQQRVIDTEIYSSEHKQINSETDLSLKPTDCRLNTEIEDDEEEEEALRALLLSKFQSPKNQKKSPKINGVIGKDALKINEFCPQKQYNRNPSEIILKEAVKRLKIHSQTDSFKDEKQFNSFVEDNTQLNEKQQEIAENDKEHTFEKLRDRLNLLKSPSHSNTDQYPSNADEFLSGPKQFSSELYNEVDSKPTAVTNSFEVTNTIDISDITRRLQKIKENVLNSTQKMNAKSQLITCGSIPKLIEESFFPKNENISISEKVQQTNESQIQNHCQMDKRNSNNFVNTEIDGDLHVIINRNKTVEANFDINTNQTTFKVTIKNNAALNSEENNTVNTFKDNHKENDNYVSKHLPLKIVENTYKKDVSMESVNSEENNTVNTLKDAHKENDNYVSKHLPLKIIKNTCKTNLSMEAVNSEGNNNSVNTQKDLHKENDNLASKHLPKKIIENNYKKDLSMERVIKTTNIMTKTDAGNIAQAIEPVSITKPTAIEKVSSNATYSLLRATKIVKPNKVINKNYDIKPKESALIVKTLKSEASCKLTDSSRLITSIDQVKHMCKVPPFVIRLQNSSNESSEEEIMEDYNSLYKPIYDYNDNASPLSLNLESPSTTPLRSNSPIDRNEEGVVEKPNLESLNLSTKETPKLRQTIIFDKTPYSEKPNKTPLAVRHLPAAAQSEYRKLVHRMKLLENKRNLTSTEENKKENISNEQNNNSFHHAEDVIKEKFKSDCGSSIPKGSLVKKVLIKNASNSKTSPTSNGTSKMNKSNILRSYENLYTKVGKGIVNNLDKSLKLVQEAKKAKITKLKLENRIKELKAEMDILQNKHKEEHQKISRIYPNICSTNDLITCLKQKRTKLYKAALNLGKTIHGDAYRINNDLKEIITTKSKNLAGEIKTVNSLKAQNVKSVDDLMINQKLRENQELEENKKKNIANCEMNTEESNVEIEMNVKNSINSDMVSSIRCIENGEANLLEPLLNIDTGGNREFQKMETDDSISHKTVEECCWSETNTLVDSEKTMHLSSYISPLEHLRNIDSNMDPNGVVCPYDLMGDCEDVTCKYIHITPKAKT